MPRKKYCGKCRWYQSTGQGDEYQEEGCMVIIGYNSNYQYKKITERASDTPQAKNYKNNCNDYSWNWFGWRGY